MSRYDHAGALYDLVSLEPFLYRRPRRRLMELLGPMPGGTVVDVGCGTGLNFPGLRQLVGAGGTVVGIDSSENMLAAARRRVRRARLDGVRIIRGDAADLLGVLPTDGVDVDTVDAVVAAFVLSLLPDDAPFWSAVDELAARRPRRVAMCDVGPPLDAAAPLRPLLRLLGRLGGADPDRQPWDVLIARAGDARHEIVLGGHVHLAVGSVGDR